MKLTSVQTFQGRGYPIGRRTPGLSPAPLVSPMPGRRIASIPDPVPVGSAAFLEGLEEVYECGQLRAADEWAGHVFVKWGIVPECPEPMEQFVRPDQKGSCARSGLLVEMDDVPEGGWELVKWLLADGAEWGDPSRIERAGHVGFVQNDERQMELHRICHRAVRHGAFPPKYFFGVPRPAEKILDLDFLYLHPSHPADPAGHGTIAGASFAWIVRHMHLTDAQRQIAFDFLVHWAMYRTTGSQVHRSVENLRGFVLGYAYVAGGSYAKSFQALAPYAGNAWVGVPSLDPSVPVALGA